MTTFHSNVDETALEKATGFQFDSYMTGGKLRLVKKLGEFEHIMYATFQDNKVIVHEMHVKQDGGCWQSLVHA